MLVNRDRVPDIPTPEDFEFASESVANEPMPEKKRPIYTKRAEAERKHKPKLRPEKESKPAYDESALLELGDTERRVLEAIPRDTAVTTDSIARGGIPAEEVMATLTILELYGMVEALPGGLYKRL